MKFKAGEQKALKELGEFLAKKGYEMNLDKKECSYESDESEILIYIDPKSDTVRADVNFYESGNAYAIGWIAAINSGKKYRAMSNLELIEVIKEYVCDNVDLLKIENFCADSIKAMESYVTAHPYVLVR